MISTNRPQLTAPSNSDIRQAAQSATRDLPMSGSDFLSVIARIHARIPSHTKMADGVIAAQS